jgi:hypothetical protein
MRKYYLGRGQKWKESSKEEMLYMSETGPTEHLYSTHKKYTEKRAEYYVSEPHEAVHISII